MSRPHGVLTGPSGGNVVDASICAHSGTTIERSFAVESLPRLKEAGALDGSQLRARFSFSRFEGHVAVAGELDGSIELQCQRCMRPYPAQVDEEFRLLLVAEAADVEEEVGGYEVIVADPVRLDVRELTEDQALLALPLVPMHPEGECPRAIPDAGAEKPQMPTQKPFGNLRDLMNKR